MMSLPEGWESDYDGTRWLFRYKATGMIQYHFPQPGDEYAEFLLDAGTGPIQLSPEESLAIEQQNKHQSISGSNYDTKNYSKTSGSEGEKKKGKDIEGENGMSATGYFDPMSFPGAWNIVSPLDEDDEVTAELPADGQQMRSPVGYVAELATQETVKCAEELAPVELDATFSTPAPILTNIAQGPAELPTHRIPVEEKTPDPKPTQPTMQLVDSSSLTSASFAYSTTKPTTKPLNGVPPRTASIKRKPVSASTNPVGLEQNKYQPWKPTQGMTEKPPQAYNVTVEALPQTSVLQNQNSELGIIGPNNSGNASSVPGSIPNALTPPSAPIKPANIESPIKNNEASFVPTVLQPAHRPATEPVSSETNNEQPISGTQGMHNTMSVPTVNHTPTVLKPGGYKPNDVTQVSEGGDGILKPSLPQASSQSPQDKVSSQHPSEHIVQVSSSHDGQQSVTKVDTCPNVSNHGTTISSEKPSSPVPPYPSSSGCVGIDEQIPAVAPLSFVKRHSSKSSEVSSIIAETQASTPHSGQPMSTPSDEISEVISIVSSFTPQTSPAPSSRPSHHLTHMTPGDTSKPSANITHEGAAIRPDVVPSAKPQSIGEQSPAPVMNTQQASPISQAPGSTPPAGTNMSKPASENTTVITQPTAIPSPSNVETRPNIPATHTLPPLVQGLSVANQIPSPSSPHQTGNPGKVSVSQGPLRPQGNPPNPHSVPSPVPSQASGILPTNQNHQLGAHSNLMSNTAQRPPQAVQPHMPTSNSNGAAGVLGNVSVPQTAHQTHGPNTHSTHSMAGPSTVGHPQTATQKPNLQQPAITGSSSHQPASRPPVGHQVSGSSAAQVSSQLLNQHYSPVTQSVSPMQSQVSSPAQSIASLHISQASTPSNTFASMNTVPGGNNGVNVSINQTTTAPVRPSSVPAHLPTQQIGVATPPVNSHSVPTSTPGNPHGQSLPTANLPAKPFPMLPGQVTPLPSQIGSAAVPSPMQQPIYNYPKPTFNSQQVLAGQHPTVPGALAGQHAMPGQTNPVLNPIMGNSVHSPASSQGQMRPPQHPASSSHPGVISAGGQQPQPLQQTAPYPSSVASGHGQSQQTPAVPSAGILPMGGQNTFAPPPAAPATTPQGKPFTSTQAGAALTDAGKAMKKWGKKMLKNPVVKQGTAVVGGALLAETMGLNPGSGAQIANKIYTNATRPPLAHAQTAPPQSNGIPGAAPQHQSVPMGQQHQPIKIQQVHPQLHPNQPHPNQPHPNQPHPNQPRPNQPQLAHPQQQPLGRPNQQQPGPPHQSLPGQPNHQQPGRPQNQTNPNQHIPAYPQQNLPQASYPYSNPHVGQPQPVYSQPGQQPVGVQIPGRPPIMQMQNPAVQAGIAASLNAQAQSQAAFYQRLQQIGMNPTMMSNPPPSAPVPMGAPVYGQTNIDPTTANALATMVGSAIGTAFRPDHSQPQNAFPSSQGQSHHQDYNSYAGNHESAHEQAHSSSVPATYTDNSNMGADATYNDNSNYSTDNTYVDNTEVVNNNIVIDNSTTVVADSSYAADTTYDNTSYADATYNNTSYADTTYDNTNYTDATAFSNTDVTNTTFDVEVNSAVYTDDNMTAFSMDETINIASTSDVAVGSGDYSGDSWGIFDF